MEIVYILDTCSKHASIARYVGWFCCLHWLQMVAPQLWTPAVARAALQYGQKQKSVKQWQYLVLVAHLGAPCCQKWRPHENVAEVIAMVHSGKMLSVETVNFTTQDIYFANLHKWVPHTFKLIYIPTLHSFDTFVLILLCWYWTFTLLHLMHVNRLTVLHS